MGVAAASVGCGAGAWRLNRPASSPGFAPLGRRLLSRGSSTPRGELASNMDGWGTATRWRGGGGSLGGCGHRGLNLAEGRGCEAEGRVLVPKGGCRMAKGWRRGCVPNGGYSMGVFGALRCHMSDYFLLLLEVTSAVTLPP